MKTIILVFLLSIMAFGQSGKSVLTQAQKDSIQAMIDASVVSSVSSDSLGYIIPQTFGAVADGITNDYTSLSAAMNYAKDNNVKLLLPTGTYKISTPIEIILSEGQSLIMEGQNATIDVSDLTTSSVVVRGDTLASIQLTQNVSRGDTIVYLSTTGLNIDEGDMITLHSTDYWAYDAKKGEIKRVKEVAATYIIIYEAFYDSYTALTTQASISKGNGFSITNVKFQGSNANESGYPLDLYVKWMQNVFIEKCEFSKNKNVNMALSGVMNAKVSKCIAYGADEYGDGYSITVGGSQNVLVSECVFDGNRHAVTTSYDIKYLFPNRYLIVDRCKVTNARGYNAALDTHPQSELTYFTNNIIYGGINIRDIGAHIEGNHIYAYYTNAISISNTDTSNNIASSYVIRNNDVEVIDTTQRVGGISFQNGIAGFNANDIIVENNRFNVTNKAVNLQFDSTATIKNIVFSDNKFRNYIKSQDESIQITGLATIDNITMDNEKYINNDDGVNIKINPTLVSYLSISNGTFITQPLSAKSFFLDNISQAKISNNYFYSQGLSDFYIDDTLYANNNYFDRKGYYARNTIDVFYNYNNYVGGQYSSLTVDDAVSTVTGREAGTSVSYVQLIVDSLGVTTDMLNNNIIRLYGDSAFTDITANPQIADGIYNGQQIWLVGASDLWKVKFDDAYLDLDLGGGGSIILGDGDMLGLVWITQDDIWHRIPNTSPYPNQFADEVLNPALTDTIFLWRTSGNRVIDSMWVKAPDSTTIQIKFGADGEGGLVFSPAQYINGETTITSFSDPTIPTNNEMYLYFTYIGDTATRFRYIIYWR